MLHQHECPAPGCGTVWQHDDRNLIGCTAIEHRDAHSCPKCGTTQYWKKGTPPEIMAEGGPREALNRLLSGLMREIQEEEEQCQRGYR